jgi:hypothetical protein
MKLLRRRLLALVSSITVLAVAGSVSSASAYTFPFSGSPTSAVGGLSGPSGCASNAPAGVGPTGGTTAQTCGGVLSFVGPAIGSVGSVVGPTIIGATVFAPVTASNGPVQN